MFKTSSTTRSKSLVFNFHLLLSQVHLNLSQFFGLWSFYYTNNNNNNDKLKESCKPSFHFSSIAAKTTVPFYHQSLFHPTPSSSYSSSSSPFCTNFIAEYGMSGLYNHSFSPARTLSPQIRSTPDMESQYLTELLAEHQKLGPFMQVLPICSRLLNQEILRVSGMASNQGLGDFDRLQYRSPSPMAPSIGFGGWNGLQHERPVIPPGVAMDWQGVPPSPSSYIVKKILRLEIPVDTFPNFNFVGRLLGPRGNSLKRVEASTGCRVYIRGKGSIKDPGKIYREFLGTSFCGFVGKSQSNPKRDAFMASLEVEVTKASLLGHEEKLRGKPGYEHLSDPLHILIEAELPVNVIDTRLRQAQEIIEELLKPVDESQDYYKRQQLRELAILNSTLREDSPHPSGSVSPFSNSGMKRAKTGW